MKSVTYMGQELCSSSAVMASPPIFSNIVEKTIIGISEELNLQGFNIKGSLFKNAMSLCHCSVIVFIVYYIFP